MGTATGGISTDSFEKISQLPAVKWSIPYSLGDSHRGYRVVGTNETYLLHYQYGNRQALRAAQGHWFEQPLDVVLGAEVARQLGYQLGNKITLSHGEGQSYMTHDAHAFHVVGILAPTSTPIDKSLFADLADLDKLHVQQKRLSAALIRLDLDLIISKLGKRSRKTNK